MHQIEKVSYKNEKCMSYKKVLGTPCLHNIILHFLFSTNIQFQKDIVASCVQQVRLTPVFKIRFLYFLPWNSITHYFFLKTNNFVYFINRHIGRCFSVEIMAYFGRSCMLDRFLTVVNSFDICKNDCLSSFLMKNICQVIHSMFNMSTIQFFKI